MKYGPTFGKTDRNRCNKCGATWWHTRPSLIHPMDHVRPDGRNCGESLSYLAGEVIQTMTGLPPAKEGA